MEKINLTQQQLQGLDSIVPLIKKNEKILKFITDNKLTKAQLEDNFIVFINALENQEDCLTCPGIDSCKHSRPGEYLSIAWRQDTLINTYSKCKYRKHRFEEKTQNQYLKYTTLNRECFNIDFKNIDIDESNIEVIKALHDFVSSFPASQKGLIIRGAFGVGKSTIMMAFINLLTKKEINCAYINCNDYCNLLNAQKFSYDQVVKDQMENTMNLIKNVRVLVIDDLGQETNTSFSRDQVLSPLLQYRFDNKLPTFITTNLDNDGLIHHFQETGSKKEKEVLNGARIMDRLLGLVTPINIKGSRSKRY